MNDCFHYYHNLMDFYHRRSDLKKNQPKVTQGSLFFSLLALLIPLPPLLSSSDFFFSSPQTHISIIQLHRIYFRCRQQEVL